MEQTTEKPPKTAPLWNIEADIARVLDAIEEDLTDEERLEAEADLRRLLDEGAAKRDRVAYAVREARSKAEWHRDNARQFTERARTYERRAERILEMVKQVMTHLSLDELRGDSYRFAMRQNPVSVELDPDIDIETFPSEFRKVTVAPRLTAIKEALVGGEIVPGCRLKADKRVDVGVL